jgi:thymidine phosphorylase
VLYSLRDATATVASIPLIVSSILSKKLAGGADIVVLDVKCGSGAFMTSLPEAETLALALSETGRRAGLKVSLSITDMDQPLGEAVGNGLEVREALRVLTCEENDLSASSCRFRDLCVHLAGETLHASGLAPDLEDGKSQAVRSLGSGAAAKKAEAWIAAQGGPSGIENVLQSLPSAAVRQEFYADEDGWVARFDAGIVGQVVLELGAGRRRKGDPIEPSVGLELSCLVGSRVQASQLLFRVHARTDEEAQAAARRVHSAVSISRSPVQAKPMILKRI